MSRVEFINELRTKLQRLPQEEIDAAIEYYEEYFEDAGPEHEEEIIRGLGSPTQIARQIIGDHALKAVVEEKHISPKKSLSTLWIVLLAIFASPIALPLAFAFVAVVFALIVAMGAIVLAMGITVVAVGISFVIAIISSFITLFIHPATGLVLIGLSLTLGGIGLLLGLLMHTIIKKGVPKVTKGVVRGYERVRGGRKAC